VFIQFSGFAERFSPLFDASLLTFESRFDGSFFFWLKHMTAQRG
jgi:hypothetical protein